jgi:pimeloyl-ACP methyl ester carboxylesterase
MPEKMRVKITPTQGCFRRPELPWSRFNFLYTELGRRVPDRNNNLEACFRAVIEIVRKRIGTGKLAIGGKSMGGRIASQIAAAGDPNLGCLIFLGCPLHPPGKVDQLASSSIGSGRPLSSRTASDVIVRWPQRLVRSLSRWTLVHLRRTSQYAKIVRSGRRLRSKMFAELQSHYLFDDRFGRPGKGNDKGKVEGWSAMPGAIS